MSRRLFHLANSQHFFHSLQKNLREDTLIEQFIEFIVAPLRRPGLTRFDLLYTKEALSVSYTPVLMDISFKLVTMDCFWLEHFQTLQAFFSISRVLGTRTSHFSVPCSPHRPHKPHSKTKQYRTSHQIQDLQQPFLKSQMLTTTSFRTLQT